MNVVIVGAHGRVARDITRLLAADGHSVTGVIRSSSQVPDIEADGGTPVILDIGDATVQQLAEVFQGNDAVVFAAGAGGSRSVYDIDRDAAIRAARAAEQAGVDRLVLISTIGAGRVDSWEGAPDYLLAKGEADAAVMASDLDWTIVRPSWLTDDSPSGQISIGHADDDPGPAVSRADIAAVVVGTLTRPGTVGAVFSVSGGGTPVEEALDRVRPGRQERA